MAAALAAISPAIGSALPANYAVLYGRAVEELNHHLADPDSTRARAMLRELIDRIVVHDGNSKGGKRRQIQLHGDLYALLDNADTT